MFSTFKKNQIRRAIASCLLVLFVSNIIGPSLSYALTSGPTAPEATSFEPVDTTDMVNLATGDFTYNMPLLEVPGPAGGYPLSLSYHDGIQTNEEASWVGLGWTLNPGAITRNVIGYPDDHKDVDNNIRTYWEGGVQKTQRYGVSYGIAYASSVSAGLTFSQDTYKGNGVGGYLGGRLGIAEENMPVSVGLSGTLGMGPYGQPYATVGLSRQVNQGISISTGVAYSTNFSGNGGSFVGYASVNKGSTGASISTNGGGGNVSIGGVSSSVHNNKRGNVSTKTTGLNLEIPIIVVPGLNVQLGFNTTRYWIDEPSDVKTNGSLYYPKVLKSRFELDRSAYDTYDLKDISTVNEEPVTDLANELGGTFPSYDKYNVTAQGLGGNIRPYLLKKQLLRQSKKENEERTVTSLPQPLLDHNYASKVAFRFENDFSNTFTVDLDEFKNNTESDYDFMNPSYDFQNESFDNHGENGNDGKLDYKLFGSKNIEWFTNEEIDLNLAIESGLRMPSVEGFTRQKSSDYQDQIGAFMITNNSGVNYHYALPAYSYSEIMQSQNHGEDKAENGYTGNKLSKPAPYAYNWLLTAITGPDYYDANSNGYADEGDWGYWVNFEYGKWSDDYKWRNPGTGFNNDIDGKFRNFAYGKKEIYYLNYIKTQTHTAAFVKKMRADAKGVVSQSGDKWKKLGSERTECEYNCDMTDDCRFGTTQECDACYDSCSDRPDIIQYDLPVPTLALAQILLFKNSSENIPQVNSEGYDNNDWYNGGNILDVEDLYMTDYIPYRTSTSSPFSGDDHDALRTIEFSHNYSLAKGTYNSFDIDGNNYQYGQSDFVFNTLGKLTLNEIQFYGKSGSLTSSRLPPTQFHYDKNPDYHHMAYDSWGYYKSDWDEEIISNNPNYGRYTTDLSSEDKDAWSLSRINTSLGSTINVEYESDNYETVSLNKKSVFKLSSLNKIAGSSDQFNVKLSTYGNSITPLIEEGDQIDIDLLVGHNTTYTPPNSNCNVEVLPSFKAFKEQGIVKSISTVTEDSELLYSVNIESSDLVSNLNSYSGTAKVKYSCPPWGPFGKNESTLENGWPTIFYGGILSSGQELTMGDGLRVKRITLENQFVEYDYIHGVTPYEPGVIPEIRVSSELLENVPAENAGIIQQKLDNILLSKFSRIISNSRELPAPGVVYKDVVVSHGVTKSSNGSNKVEPETTKYSFQTYDENFVTANYQTPKEIPSNFNYIFVDTYVDPDDPYEETIILEDSKSRKMQIKDFSNRLGLLKSIEKYDALENKTSGTYYHYLHEDRDYSDNLNSIFKNQGLIEEAFSDLRVVNVNDEDIMLGMISKRSKFPVVPTGVTSVDYEKGIKQTTHNLAFDFYSGEITKTLSDDGKGNYFVTENIPAYRKYTAMGLKSENVTRKNMLTQSAGSFKYHVFLRDKSNPYSYSARSLVSATANTWIDWDNSRESVWRKKDTYIYVGENINDDGFYFLSDDVYSFYWEDVRTNGQIPATWERMMTIAEYDKYSHPIEVYDQNLIRSSAIYGYNEEKIIATGTNTLLQNLKYSGFEDEPYTFSGSNYFTGDLKFTNAYPSTGSAHTGNKYLNFASSSSSVEAILYSQEIYNLSFWVRESHLSKLRVNSNGSILTGTSLQTGTSNGWVRCETNITKSGTEPITVKILAQSAGMHIDDVMIKPVSSSVNAFVYNNSDELTHILDNNNLYTRFEYDAYGRLKATFKETLQYDEVQVSEHKINFGAN